MDFAGSGSPRVVLVAPGSGLGHLTRCASLARGLETAGVGSRILTPSPLGPGVGRLLEVAIEYLPLPRWTCELRERVEALAPDLLVLDTFPDGWRGEWDRGFPEGPHRVLLARRLRQGSPQARERSVFRRSLVLEPLDAWQLAWLGEISEEVVGLPGRIRLEVASLSPGDLLPPELREVHASGGLGLVVHSGPPRELTRLLERARGEQAAGRADALAVIHPLPPRIPGLACVEAYPVAPLFPEAAFVVSGAGYNAVAEGLARARRFLPLPFPRRWDDQEARLGELEGAGEMVRGPDGWSRVQEVSHESSRVNGVEAAIESLVGILEPSTLLGVR